MRPDIAGLQLVQLQQELHEHEQLAVTNTASPCRAFYAVRLLFAEVLFQIVNYQSLLQRSTKAA